jgi:hypothetical protein
MPRERLHALTSEQRSDEHPLPGDDQTADQTAGRVWYEFLPNVEAHWHEGSHVQLSVEVDREHLKRMLAEEPDDVSTIKFFTAALERSEVNHAIKTLRRARNSAFGVDE